MRKRNVHVSAFEAIITVDKSGEVIEFNAAAEKMFGYTSKAAKGRNISNLIVPPALREKHRQGLQRYVKTGMKHIVGRPLTTKGMHKGGGEFPLQMIINPVRDGDRQLFTAFIRDLTDRKQAVKRQRKLEDELSELSHLAAMGELTTVLAHELNQPLAVIASGSQLFRDTLRSGTGDATAMLNTAELVAEQSQRAGDVIRRVRTLVSKEGTRRKSTSVNGLIRGIDELIRLDAQRADIAVELDLDKDLSMVFADPVHIQQVILNLVHNAVEAINDNRVTPGLITVATDASDDDMVMVYVRDNGKGIPAEIRDQIFDPFFTTKTTGLGMGLSICRTIIEAHEGSLWIAPDDDTGTVFVFTLPAIGKKSVEIAVENPLSWVNQGLGNITLWGKNLAMNMFSLNR